MASVDVAANVRALEIVPEKGQPTVAPPNLGPLPNAGEIKPSPGTSLAEVAYQATAFAGKSYGLEGPARELNAAFNGDVLAGVGVLGTITQLGKAKQVFRRISGSLLQDLNGKAKLGDIPSETATELIAQVKKIVELARGKVDQTSAANIAKQAWEITQDAQRKIYWLPDGPNPFSGPSPSIRQDLVGSFNSVYHTLRDVLTAKLHAGK